MYIITYIYDNWHGVRCEKYAFEEKARGVVWGDEMTGCLCFNNRKEALEYSNINDLKSGFEDGWYNIKRVSAVKIGYKKIKEIPRKFYLSRVDMLEF